MIRLATPVDATAVAGITVRGSGPNLTIIDPEPSGRGFHCDGVTNEQNGSSCTTFYIDADDDGYGLTTSQ